MVAIKIWYKGIRNASPPLIVMKKEIYYHDSKAFLVLRKIHLHQLNPKWYGINSDDWLRVLKAWKEHLGADNVLRVKDTFLICERIEDAKIVE